MKMQNEHVLLYKYNYTYKNAITMCYHKPGGSDLMKIELPQVQTQSGTKDCGLFAIAFSYEIASGNTILCSVRFNQSNERSCFEKQKDGSFSKECIRNFKKMTKLILV